jgi:hypothetical protein
MRSASRSSGLDLQGNPRLLDQVLAPAVHILDNYVRGVYRDGAFDDFRFVRLGVCRVLSQAASGRDFLQMAREILKEEVARASFFDSLHCPRRSQVLADLNTMLVRRSRSGMTDLLARFPEVRDVPVYAVDGHHIAHAVHSPSDPKGEKVSANNLYLLCLHTGLMSNLGAVQGDGRHGHEMPVFRRQVVPWLLARHPRRGKAAPIFIGDPAFVDKVFWTRMVVDGNRARFITRTKSNMKPTIYSSYSWDAGKPINEGVLADLSVGFDGAMTMRMIRYRDPESGIEYEFLTSIMDLEPGLIAVLYLTRWRIEKLFDTTKNKLEETKSWAVGPVAQETRAHLVALTHNLLVLLRGELQRDHGIREEKVERKREAQLLQRQIRAQALGRQVAAVQKLLPVAVQLTAQFIRSLRNAILSGMRWTAALELLRTSTKGFLATFCGWDMKGG